MRKNKYAISYVDYRSGEPVERTKQFFTQSEFNKALKALTGIPRTHISVTENVTINIYPEQAGDLFDKGLVG